MTFVLGKRSRSELKGVDPRLVSVVELALTLSPVDFVVHDGLRTVAEQVGLVARGVSQTTNSRHLTGHAVDLVPWVGALRWSWPELFAIAGAVRDAARELSVPIRWGGAWDVTLNETENDPKDVSAAYALRRKAAGRRVFLDGPHFEVVG